MNDRETGTVGTAMVISAVIVALALAFFPAPRIVVLLAIPIGMILMASGASALAGATGLTGPRRTMRGILVPGAAWGIAAIIACCAPWPIMVALHRSLGPTAMPMAVAAALCGTAGAILAGRWTDLTLNTPSPIDDNSKEPE